MSRWLKYVGSVLLVIVFAALIYFDFFFVPDRPVQVTPTPDAVSGAQPDVIHSASPTIPVPETPEPTESFEPEPTSEPEKIVDNTPGIDLHGTYDENPIVINTIEIPMEKEYNVISYPQISGLKDKAVEELVNKRISEYVDEQSDMHSDLNSLYLSIIGNFSNILSISGSVSYGENYDYDIISLNINLVDGSDISINDVFKKDADLLSIVRGAVYEDFVLDYAYVDESVMDEIYPYIRNENYVIYKTKEILSKWDTLSFSLSPRYMSLNLGEVWLSIDFVRNANDVAIYSKYLVDDDLYEDNSIGRKGLITCSYGDFDYYPRFESGFVRDNLWVESVIGASFSWMEDTASEEYWDLFYQCLDEETEKMDNVEANLMIIAEENPDRAYILFNKLDMIPQYVYTTDMFGNEGQKFFSSICIKDGYYLYEMPVDVFNEKYIDVLFDVYRYYRYENIVGNYIDIDEDDDVNFTKTYGPKFYDIFDKREVDIFDYFVDDVSLGEIFEAPVQNFIDMYAKETLIDTSVSELLETAEFKINCYSIDIYLPDWEGFKWYEGGDLIKSVNLYFGDIDPKYIKNYFNDKVGAA